ncbi:hypothetical protein [Enterococcus caccae]|uniref:Uncharacterized protein n=1 Tax=Enterococcus caccae ATCC BAA-1240 TaxID=1158612 RepID=R3TW01_9ENTE|nr:hypothetical protein [Enterococcus caccae]EOL45784.1 hypothetical protein UC7_01581 [Enterococcus caccae ATCC BAA-1240]EOT60980.1 hypothetical protein I580_01882 [Enterococcus caccae ATCC BAA-1240]OJG27985.1 hypothetical protein RU98_GL002194 [Enterococcus caccae]
MDLEVKYLKEKIEFLEALLELNSNSLQKAMESNRKLIDYIKYKGK